MRGALAGFLVLGAASAANADVLWHQNWAGQDFVEAQVFPDLPAFSIYQFDDIVVGGAGWLIDTVRARGVEFGNPNLNADVVLGLFSDHAIGAMVHGPFSGAEVQDPTGSSDLLFDLGGFELALGNYWISAWVVRPNAGGGQWHWGRQPRQPTIGDQHWFHNPGGGWGYGPNPRPGSDRSGTRADLAFTIEGELVPEPATLGLLSLAGLALLRRRW